MSRWPKLFSIVLLALITLGAGVILQISSQNADLLIHRIPPPEGLKDAAATVGLDYEDVALTTGDGLRLAAWYIPSQNGAAIIAQHGYHASRDEMINEAQMLARHGYGVLMFDARAHGYSDGDLITFGLKEIADTRAAIDYLLTRPDVDAGRIGALGNSQGAVTLILATAQYPEIKALVGDSPYAALQDEIATGVKAFTGLSPFPFAPLIQFFAERKAGFTADSVAPIHHIAQIAPRPVFLMQGGADSLIPIDSGRRLYDAAGEPKALWFDPALGHVQFDTARADEYERRVVEFFNAYLLGEGE